MKRQFVSEVGGFSAAYHADSTLTTHKGVRCRLSPDFSNLLSIIKINEQWNKII